MSGKHEKKPTAQLGLYIFLKWIYQRLQIKKIYFVNRLGNLKMVSMFLLKIAVKRLMWFVSVLFVSYRSFSHPQTLDMNKLNLDTMTSFFIFVDSFFQKIQLKFKFWILCPWTVFSQCNCRFFVLHMPSAVGHVGHLFRMLSDTESKISHWFWIRSFELDFKGIFKWFFSISRQTFHGFEYLLFILQQFTQTNKKSGV